MNEERAIAKPHKPVLARRSGKIWFSASTERRFYFFLTLIMLVAGILYKMGVI